MSRNVRTEQIENCRSTRVVTSWPCAPDELVLGSGEVHVWRAALDLRPTQYAKLSTTLAPEEGVRAARFRFRKDRKHFIAARGALRDILSRYVSHEAAQLEFCCDRGGKPNLAASINASGLRFNLSHSHGLALYAIARGREVGVDVELIRTRVADGQIAERFFSPREASDLKSVPVGLQSEAFFSCWTRKEAYLKARGDGLAVPLDSFEVSLVPGEPAALLSSRYEPRDTSRWTLQALTPRTGYIAAVAAEGKNWNVKLWQWEPP